MLDVATFQFFPDGTFVLDDGSGPITGTYSFPDESHLKLQDAKEVNVFEVIIARDTLSMSIRHGSTSAKKVLERIH